MERRKREEGSEQEIEKVLSTEGREKTTRNARFFSSRRVRSLDEAVQLLDESETKQDSEAKSIQPPSLGKEEKGKDRRKQEDSQLNVLSTFPQLPFPSRLQRLQVLPPLNLEIVVHPRRNISLNTVLEPDLVEHGGRFAREPRSNEADEERELRLVPKIGTSWKYRVQLLRSEKTRKGKGRRSAGPSEIETEEKKKRN